MGLIEERVRDIQIAYHQQWAEWCLGYIRYLQRDIAFLQTLVEANREQDWDFDLELKATIWEEEKQIAELKKEVVDARAEARAIEEGNTEGIPG